MDKEAVLSRLQPREAELRELGVVSLSIFGSTARGEEANGSDVDLAVTFDSDFRIGAFALIRIESRIADMLQAKADVVTEPCDSPRFQKQIDRDRVHVF